MSAEEVEVNFASAVFRAGEVMASDFQGEFYE